MAKAPSVKRRLRLALERALIPRALKAQLDLPAQLSNSAILQERRDRYGDVLRAVRRDYG